MSAATEQKVPIWHVLGPEVMTLMRGVRRAAGGCVPSTHGSIAARPP